MSRTAFGIFDAFDDPDSIEIKATPASLDADAPPTNAIDDRPKVVWMNKDGQWAPSTDNATDSYMPYLNIIEGGGSEIQVSQGVCPHPKTGVMYALFLEGRLQSHPQLNYTYTVGYDPVTGLFTITSSSSIQILWKTGTQGRDNWASGTQPRNLAPWLGFDTGSDSGSGTTFQSAEPRFDTEICCTITRNDPTSKTTANVFAAILQSAAHESGKDVNFSDFKIYGHASDLGPTRKRWEESASSNLTFSPRSTDPDSAFPTNKIQIAHADGGAAMSALYWFVSWRYFDKTKAHSVGLLKALSIVTSTTRQITQLRGHGIIDPSTTLGVDSYWPVHNQQRWVAPLSFEMWGAADFRAVVQETVKYGRCRGILWALRWDKIVDGTYTAAGEADKGFLLWGSWRSYSDDDYEGAGANEYLTADITVEQVR